MPEYHNITVINLSGTNFIDLEVKAISWQLTSFST